MVKRNTSSRRMGLLTLFPGAPGLCALALCCTALMPMAGAQSPGPERLAVIKDPKAASPSYVESRAQLDRLRRQAQLKNELLEKRRMSGRLSNMAIFQPKDGGAAILTNRPTKYRQRDDYQEIKIQFDPIVIPGRYRKPPAFYSNAQIRELVSLYAKQYELDESLIHAMIACESNGNPKAISNKGASGLMQLMPGTAAEMGVKNIFDPAENIAGGTQYLAKLLALFDGNVSFALAGYNAGPENVKQYGGIPPFAETQSYVRNVLDRWRQYRLSGALDTFTDASVIAPGKLTAKDGSATKQPASIRSAAKAKQFHVRFKSGNVQVADKVVNDGDYYYIEVRGHNYRILKEQVDSVEDSNGVQLAEKM